MSDRPIRILCFGDSNTWGYSPQDGSRYPSNIRWTGVLQKFLGQNYQIIEEGLNGRTTDLDYSNRIGRNGRQHLIPCLDSQAPLHFVILNLGANDTKTEFARSPESISTAIEGLIRIIKSEGLENPSPEVKIILVSPSAILEGIGGYGDKLVGASGKIKKLATLYREIALRYGCIFVDLSHVEPSKIDGVHLSEESHKTIARIFYETICKETH